MKLKNTLHFVLILGMFFSLQENAFGQNANAGWKKELNKQLQLLGHRNWILIVDAAYPLQSNPAINTVATGADHLSVVKEVLAAVDNAPHVAPHIFLDKELDFVPADEAPGVEAYKEKLMDILGEQTPEKMPHEEIIYMIDEAAEIFSVLVLKTDFTIPYTSVFINLDCGYWTPDQEKKLRESMPDNY